MLRCNLKFVMGNRYSRCGDTDIHDKLPVRGTSETPPPASVQWTLEACRAGSGRRGPEWDPLQIRRPISLLPDILLTRGDPFFLRCLRPTSQVCRRDQLGPDATDGVWHLSVGAIHHTPSGPVGDVHSRWCPSSAVIICLIGSFICLIVRDFPSFNFLI